MSTSMSVPTMKQTQIFQDILRSSYARRLLLDQSPSPAPSPYADDTNFDANVVMVLSVLLCALVCSLGLNSVIRCALRCSSLAPSEAGDNQPAARLSNTGVKRKALKSFQTVSYSADLNLPGLDTECAICLSEFVSEERVKLLPTCHHGFHVRCIDKWLSSHSSCPTCRHCLIQTCQKIADCSQTSSLNTTQPPQDSIIVQIAPLQPERSIYCFRFTPVGRANHYMPSLKACSIVKVGRFEVSRCSSMYKITDHPFLIRFISLTIIDEVITGAPEINLQSRLDCSTISK
ncbi:hypothetical protein YC2023_075376 [Brassica napus]